VVEEKHSFTEKMETGESTVVKQWFMMMSVLKLYTGYYES